MSNNIKVCHVSSVHTSTDGRIFQKECVSLARHGYDVTLIARGEARTESGVSIISFPEMPRWKRIFFSHRIAFKLAKKVDADIYHLHDPELLLIARKLKRLGKKVIFDSHEDYYQQIQHKSYLPKLVRLPIAKGFRRYQKYISLNLDGFIFPAMEPEIDIAIPITIVGNSPIVFDNKDNYKNLPMKDRERCICYIGALSESRGITQLIKVAYMANCKLILAGAFVDDTYYKRCQAMKEYSVVDFRGYLSSSELSSVLDESRIGMAVLLNVGQYGKTNAFGIKEMEYALAGLPVFLSEAPFHNMMVDKYGFGVCVNPEDLNGYVDTLNFYLDNYALLEQMGANGRNLVLTQLNWENEFHELLALYKNIELALYKNIE